VLGSRARFIHTSLADSSNYTITHSRLTFQRGTRKLYLSVRERPTGALLKPFKGIIMTSKKTETIVTVRKHGEKIEQTNAAAVSQVQPEEFDTASAATSTLNAKLCLNLLDGNVSSKYKKAANVWGGLRELMPNASNADLNAIKVCLQHTPAKLRQGWQAYVDKRQRIHGVTLQALVKSVTPPKETTKPFKQRYAEDFAELYRANPDVARSAALEKLYMLAIDAGWENPDEANMTV
jgi:hypothetical protein